MVLIPNFLNIQKLSCPPGTKPRKTHPKRIQNPRTPLPHQPQDITKIIRKHDRAEPPDVAQPCCLEYLLVLVDQLLVLGWVGGAEVSGVVVVSAFVYFVDFLGYVLSKSRIPKMKLVSLKERDGEGTDIMVPIKQN